MGRPGDHISGAGVAQGTDILLVMWRERRLSPRQRGGENSSLSHPQVPNPARRTEPEGLDALPDRMAWEQGEALAEKFGELSSRGLQKRTVAH